MHTCTHVYKCKHTGPLMQQHTCMYNKGADQGHVHHKAPLKIIILNIVLLLVDDDLLYMTTLCHYFHKFIYSPQCGSSDTVIKLWSRSSFLQHLAGYNESGNYMRPVCHMTFIIYNISGKL